MKGKGDSKPSFKNDKKATQFTIEKKADQFAVETAEAESNCLTEQELQFALACKETFYDDYPIAFTEMIAHSFSCSFEFSSQMNDSEAYESFNAEVMEHFVQGNLLLSNNRKVRKGARGEEISQMVPLTPCSLPEH